MARIIFPSKVPFIDPARIGTEQQIEFYPLSPGGFTVLQSGRTDGNRSEHWSMDRSVVEVCQHTKGEIIQIEIPCIPSGRLITGTGANEVLTVGKTYWDEFHKSVENGEEFIIDATGIPDAVQYFYTDSTTGSNQYDTFQFLGILQNGDMEWERVQRWENGCRVYDYTLRFGFHVLRQRTQVFGYE